MISSSSLSFSSTDFIHAWDLGATESKSDRGAELTVLSVAQYVFGVERRFATFAEINFSTTFVMENARYEDFEPGKFLGRGQFGEVRLATHKVLSLSSLSSFPFFFILFLPFLFESHDRLIVFMTCVVNWETSCIERDLSKTFRVS
jgi:hypothetical protein